MLRRHFLSLIAATAAPNVALASSGRLTPGFRQLDLSLPGAADIARRALVLVPKHLNPYQKHPAVVLLHGYGQASSEHRAIRAWADEYDVLDAYQRLSSPPVARVFRSVTYLYDHQLHAINHRLQTDPFNGLVLICPVTPVPYFAKRSGPTFQTYADWIEQELMPAVRRRAPVSEDPAKIGLAGVSMGGHVALEVLMRKPDLFGAFTGIQIAIKKRAAWVYGGRLARAFARVGERPVQIITSSRDTYRWANESLSMALAKKGVPAEFLCPPGPHTGNWMREAGSLEMLLFQDRALHSTPSVAKPRHLARKP